ncbi:AAA family ATPase [Herbiconiux sp. KACC 21604]|uniref:AAA family ATPase n=1 Tax=unclassified Herbiconiux TaxID=2618217 RepID=UPI001492919D|nr:AAA family ATPase [Herbiconiux sp. SALV-R1]QJU52786.1 AAA family ATPase [Herbiconiux sp. SALV-R1]WPO87692.1 AAA family ATPase [Herbiconiux sp. KACC 21604]
MNYSPDPWDRAPAGEGFYPFVKIALDPSVTTIVGANESGKSQVLEAIEFGLTGENIIPRDFCRYSPFFLQDRELLLPEFGLKFSQLADKDVAAINDACGTGTTLEVPDEIAVFRVNATPKLRMYMRHGDEWSMSHIKKPSALKDLHIPLVYKIDARTPLPDSVPIQFLASGNEEHAVGHRGIRSRLDMILNNRAWFGSPAVFAENSETIRTALDAQDDGDERERAKFRLARTLLLDVAKLPAQLFEQLSEAIRDGKHGYAKSIVDTINGALARSLNFQHWWRQDSHFELFVEHQEYHLDFMIRDRTGRSYSFDERSGGLKYFLSYFVQYLAHAAARSSEQEILLMDEPDAYLSSSGQKDLLQIFDAFAFPRDDGLRPVQVVYVTHSPFLIDKNHAERIRVLEKGRNDEGTRVVANASRNHYEPLRTALGEFVAETTFMGNCNLIIEGPSDQVLIAGVSTWLRRRSTSELQNLDLNDISIVPAGSASHVPYMAFLARGRDVDKPAVIVLLDSDDAGNQAVKKLKKGGPGEKQLVAPEYVVQLAQVDGISTANPDGVVGIEDLIPLEIAKLAACRYTEEFAIDADLNGMLVIEETVYPSPKGTLDGLERLARKHLDDESFHLDKIGFARHVLAVIGDEAADVAAIAQFESNFRALLKRLAGMQRSAMRVQRQELIRDRVNRIRDRFQTDHESSAKREAVTLLIEEIRSQLDESVEADLVRDELLIWEREYKLDDDPRADVENYHQFLDRLRGLAYVGTRSVQQGVPTV